LRRGKVHRPRDFCRLPPWFSTLLGKRHASDKTPRRFSRLFDSGPSLYPRSQALFSVSLRD
jgi:hypothetical protein